MTEAIRSIENSNKLHCLASLSPRTAEGHLRCGDISSILLTFLGQWRWTTHKTRYDTKGALPGRVQMTSASRFGKDSVPRTVPEQSDAARELLLHGLIKTSLDRLGNKLCHLLSLLLK